MTGCAANSRGRPPPDRSHGRPGDRAQLEGNRQQLACQIRRDEARTRVHDSVAVQGRSPTTPWHGDVAELDRQAQDDEDFFPQPRWASQAAREPRLTSEQALSFVRKHGVVLESANGPIPGLVQAIVGAGIKGNWWSHPRGKEIFLVTRFVRDSDQVLVCRLMSGKVTLVHRRLWPALVRCAGHFRPDRISRLIEVHTRSGAHSSRSVPFPDWVPESVAIEAGQLSEESALNTLSAFLPGFEHAS